MSFFVQNDIRQTVKVPILRLMLHYSLLALLFFSFNAQHILAFSINERSEVETTNADLTQTTKQHYNLFLKEGFPSQNIFSAVEMELEEDEEVSHSSDDINLAYSRNTANFESLYQSLIRTKFLHLVKILNQQPADPLFLLYHSWKYSIA